MCGNLQGKCRPLIPSLCEPAQSKCTRTFHQSHFVWKFKGKMAADTSGDIVLCEPAQSKCTWTCHKRHFARKSTKENAKRPSIEHRALTVTVRTPQCGHTVWGKKKRNVHPFFAQFFTELHVVYPVMKELWLSIFSMQWRAS